MAACIRLISSYRMSYQSTVRPCLLSSRSFSTAWPPATPPVSSAPSHSSSGFTFPTGFRAAGVRCGIKKKKDALDFAMVASSSPCTAAAVFTTNRFQAAPVLTSRRLLQTAASSIGGVVINSGCANACTGSQGLADAAQMQQLAEQAGLRHSLVMSTGVIGPFLDMAKIGAGVQAAYAALSAEQQGWESASRAIMTTDTVPKLLAKSYQLASGKAFRIAGMCKGAGMIHPNMATMLGVLTTDAAITAECLQSATRYAVDRSFNSISIDGDMSTNDTVAVLANGQAVELTEADVIRDVSSPAFAAFQSSLTSFAIELAQKLVRDGEGATKFVTIEVRGAASFSEARQLCSAIATSALVKTAMYGQDANWGRIVCAVGYAGVELDPLRVSLWFVDADNDSPAANLQLLKDGQPFQTDEDRATALVRRHDIHVRVDVGKGEHTATMWTCDFSIDYVKINADYRS